MKLEYRASVSVPVSIVKFHFSALERRICVAEISCHAQKTIDALFADPYIVASRKEVIALMAKKKTTKKTTKKKATTKKKK